MKLVVKPIKLSQLRQWASKGFGDLVKAVVDVDKNLLVIDAELHADEENYLLKKGSRQKSLWGINLYPAKFGSDDFIEFDSVINFRPSLKNLSRGVENVTIRQRITSLVMRKITA